MNEIKSLLAGRVYPDGRMDVQAAADYVGLTAKTLAQKRCNGTGPEFIRVGGKRIFYKKEELDRYIDSGKSKKTSARRSQNG